MPAGALTEQQQQLDARQENSTTFTEKARDTLTDAGEAVKNVFQKATEPLTHAQQKKNEEHAAEEQQFQACEEECLTEQHKAALHCPGMHDKTKIHFMMESKHNANYAPSPSDKLERKEVEAPKLHSTALESVKQVFKGKSADRVTQEALLQQHRAAVQNPSAHDKTKFAFI
jgi:hypothetical protein